MAQQLPRINIPMIQEPIIGVDMTQQDYDNMQRQGMLPQQQQQQIVDVSPQSEQVMVNAGAQKKGIDWAGALQGFGNYLAAAGQGINPNATTMGAGLSGASDTVLKHQQNIKNFQTMAPYYQQMGYDVSGLNPSKGGSGVNSTPEKMIDLQSQIAQRNYLNEYRQTLAEARLNAQNQKQQSTPTIGDLMLYNPQFKAMMNAQYDFSNGQNSDVLKRPMPKEVLQSLMPKNVNMNYTGGLNSSKKVDVNNTYNGAGAKPKSKKLIF